MLPIGNKTLKNAKASEQQDEKTASTTHEKMQQVVSFLTKAHPDYIYSDAPDIHKLYLITQPHKNTSCHSRYAELFWDLLCAFSFDSKACELPYAVVTEPIQSVLRTIMLEVAQQRPPRKCTGKQISYEVFTTYFKFLLFHCEIAGLKEGWIVEIKPDTIIGKDGATFIQINLNDR